jgi:Holliday junction resolvase RusA-like endonuclease
MSSLDLFEAPQTLASPASNVLTQTSIEFDIPGQPVAKARARTQPLYGRDGKPVLAAGRVVMRTYTPEETERYENRVAMMARQAMGERSPFTTPVELRLLIGVEVPQSWSDKRRRLALSGLIGATKKLDMDNVEKAVLDGMNRIVYDDDSRVVRKVSGKFYAARPGVRVLVTLLAMQSA